MATRDASSGFSLIEFLLAAFIVSVCILGLLSLQLMSMRHASVGRERGTAAAVARSVLQAIQVEGHKSFFAKEENLPFSGTRTFTTGTTLQAATPYGGYNMNGIQVTDANGTALANLATLVPDPDMRSPVMTVTWARRSYNGADVPVATGPQVLEFVVNVVWAEDGQSKALSMSKLVRF